MTTATSGEEALEKIAKDQPDLVVLDVMMPYMDGFEVLQQVRRDPKTAVLPAIMLTAQAQDADVFREWQSGPDYYLAKPVNLLNLNSLVGHILDSPCDEPCHHPTTK